MKLATRDELANCATDLDAMADRLERVTRSTDTLELSYEERERYALQLRRAQRALLRMIPGTPITSSTLALSSECVPEIGMEVIG